jgi:hypothetical protein
MPPPSKPPLFALSEPPRHVSKHRLERALRDHYQSNRPSLAPEHFVGVVGLEVDGFSLFARRIVEACHRKIVAPLRERGRETRTRCTVRGPSSRPAEMLQVSAVKVYKPYRSSHSRPGDSCHEAILFLTQTKSSVKSLEERRPKSWTS